MVTILMGEPVFWELDFGLLGHRRLDFKTNRATLREGRSCSGGNLKLATETVTTPLLVLIYGLEVLSETFCRSCVPNISGKS